VGPVPFKPLEELQRADFLAGLCNKALGPVEIVRHVSPTVLREAPEYHSTFPDSSRSRRQP
jgi:hypothetical protein